MRTVDFVAGPAAGFAVCLAFYPFDTLKTRVQSPTFRRHAAGALNGRRLWFRGLYQGIGPIIIATMPASAAFFTSYESCKSFLSTSLPSLPPPIIHCVSSSLAELLGCVVATPAEVIKQNAQVLYRSQGSSSMQALRSVGRNPRDLWRGFTLLAGRNLPFIVIQFPLYERLKAVFKRDKMAEDNDLVEVARVTGLAATLSGGVAAWVTTPVDVVKTIIMLDAAKKKSEGLGVPRMRLKGVDVLKSIFKEEGVKGLWRGGSLRGVWTAAGSGLYLGVYECIMMQMGEN